MDELDAAILREIYRDRVLLWGGSDPRLGTTELADRLGVDRTTVWARLRSWKQQGFLVRHDVLPNPSLFGAGIAGGDVRIDDPRQKAQALEALQLVDGVLCGLDMVGPYVLVLYALDSQAALDRCTRLVAQLPGVSDVSMCIPFESPRSRLEPTARDWRILEALRELPDRPLREVAQKARTSARTLTRRYEELLRADAIWSFPVLDFGRYRGAVFARFVALARSKADVAALVNATRRDLPQVVLWESLADLSPALAEEHPWVDLYCHLASVGEAEDVQRWLLALDCVEDVEVYFPRGWFVASSWFDERIARARKSAGE